MEDTLKDKFLEISKKIDDDFIKNASNEELMAYLFLVEKMKLKLEQAINLESEE